MGNRPFAYNPGSAITGSSQYGTLAVGTGGIDYGADAGGVKWWSGPDEDLGYVIATSVPTGNQPTPIGNVGNVTFWRSDLNDLSFTNLSSIVTGQTFANASAAKAWLETNGYWTSWTSAGTVFSQSFIQTAAPTSIVETAWNTFRASLTGSYTSFTWSSTNGNSITVTHPTSVQTLANALRNATNNTQVTINSVIWRVGTGCGTPKIGGVAVEFSNIASCSATSTYALRPMINNANWGGTNQSTVGAPSQTITLTFS
jgi:hypothetical protein